MDAQLAAGPLSLPGMIQSCSNFAESSVLNVQLLSQLVRKAEHTSQQLASQLRQNGGTPDEAARSSNCPSSPIGDLILAARSSFQAFTRDADEQPDQPSSSGDASSDCGQQGTGTTDTGTGEDGAVSAPSSSRRRRAPSGAGPQLDTGGSCVIKRNFLRVDGQAIGLLELQQPHL